MCKSLETFKIEHDAYLSVKDDDGSKVPKINHRWNDLKIMFWSHIFNYCLSNSYGSRGPLTHVIREDPTMTNEVMEPLLCNFYYEESGRLISYLESRLTHGWSIFKNHNAGVCVKIEEASGRTYVESIIKYFPVVKTDVVFSNLWSVTLVVK